MSNKQISKDNREYWQRKLSSKFDDKKSAIKSLHQQEINETTQKNFPIFKKRLGIEKDMENYLKVEKEFNDYSKNYQKRLEEKREMVKKLFSVIKEKLVNWSETRQWNYHDIPKYDYEGKMYDLKDRLDNFLKSQCKEETKKHFTNLKKVWNYRNLMSWKKKQLIYYIVI
jgi:hypothetical protein